MILAGFDFRVDQVKPHKTSQSETYNTVLQIESYYARFYHVGKDCIDNRIISVWSLILDRSMLKSLILDIIIIFTLRIPCHAYRPNLLERNQVV